MMVAKAWWVGLLMALPIAAVFADTDETQSPAANDAQVVAADDAQADAADEAKAVAADEAPKPRLELHVPSVRHLGSELSRSHAAAIGQNLDDLLLEAGSMSSDGVDIEEAAAVAEQLRRWPDTRLDAAIFAADIVGNPRWAIRVAWPIADLQSRLAELLETSAAETLLKDVDITPVEGHDGAFAVRVPQATLAYLRPDGDRAALIVSHLDLPFPDEPFTGTDETESASGGEAGKPLIVCRLNLKPTEKDSGATFFSSFSAVTDVVYAAHVDESGAWVETGHIHWPPIIGMGAKSAFDKVTKSFFVPDVAFGAMTIGSPIAPGMIENMAGLGPQMIMTGPGQFEMVGEMTVGPIASRADGDVCFTLLPGTGFFPVPDMILQTRIKRAEDAVDDFREQVEAINDAFREKDLDEPWREIEVAGKTAFVHESTGGYGGMMMPVSGRQVIFVTQEYDVKGEQRDYLVIANTTTSAEGIVDRWLSLPRTKSHRYMPRDRKTYAQAWINWRRAYHWIRPYVNLSTGSVLRKIALPKESDVKANLSDGYATLDIKYAGLSIDHTGPLPAGIFALPVMATIALAEDDSGSSDLARERHASRNLKVLHHHATLFKKDFGRWPAEVGELDGYVDFAGHPGLLRVQQSAGKRRSEWLKSAFGFDDDDDEESQEDEDELAQLDEEDDEIDDDIFVINWSPDAWRLGYVPDTFEHLEALYVDHSGEIHRVPAKAKTPTEAKSSATESNDEPIADADKSGDGPDEDAKKSRSTDDETSGDADDDAFGTPQAP